MRNSIGTLLFTWLRGEEIGRDAAGNRYYREKVKSRHRGMFGSMRRERRWVVFDGHIEASRIPPEWHAWIHHMVAEPPNSDDHERKPWEIEHQPNPTFTEQAYRPPGHTLLGGKRDKATGDYEPWSPA
ncbi:MAG: NADH:ubiquinone oxidoreductase subunit NDUFA12 [Rhodovibrionaceae bacterium]|nr:NADH:ubiquinone oxidoreductase subunit NDUFA12 [Rhodovibrionaceae bacterium]